MNIFLHEMSITGKRVYGAKLKLVSSTRNELKKDFTQRPQSTQSVGIGEIGVLKNFSGVVLRNEREECLWSRFPLRPGVA